MRKIFAYCLLAMSAMLLASCSTVGQARVEGDSRMMDQKIQGDGMMNDDKKMDDDAMMKAEVNVSGN